MSLLRILLLPISLLYYLYQLIRNKFYDQGIIESKHFDIPTISVGNLSVGGTGKTPLVNYIISNFKNNYKLAFLSRGYGRDSSGYILADEKTLVTKIGDEPFLIKKNHGEILVVVSEDRVLGVSKTINENSGVQFFILDDAFQHRRLKCDLNIVVTKYDNPYYSDFVLPTGNLREPISGIKRAQIIVISKCPNNLGEVQRQEIIKKIKPSDQQKVFFTTIVYDESLVGRVDLNVMDLTETSVLLVTGIADSSDLEKYLNNKKISFEHLKFNDHHIYSEADIDKIKSKSKNKKIITTEKDYHKILDIKSFENMHYIGIKVKFLDGKNNFNSEIEKVIN